MERRVFILAVFILFVPHGVFKIGEIIADVFVARLCIEGKHR